jgi:hypothetical protein
MAIRIKTVLLAVSSALNVLSVFLLVSALALPGKTASVSFRVPEDGGKPYVAAALVAVFPGESEAVFNPVEITMKKGETAALQFSVVSRGSQANWLFTPLYDHAALAVRPEGFGLLVTALAGGETRLQTLTDAGVRDIAVIRIAE